MDSDSWNRHSSSLAGSLVRLESALRATKKWALTRRSESGPAQDQSSSCELEIVTQRELHFTRSAGGRGDISERARRDVEIGVSEDVVVKQIVRLPPELQLVLLRPRHLPFLQNGQIHVPEPGTSESVSVSDRKSGRERQTCQSRLGIGEKLNGGSHVVNTGGAGGNADIRDRRAVETEAYRERARRSAHG